MKGIVMPMWKVSTVALVSVGLSSVCLTIAFAQGAAPHPVDAAANGSVDHGHSLFLKDGCSLCHGTVGQGGAAGPRIGAMPPPVAYMMTYIRNPTGEMPPYTSKVVSDDDVRDIHAYLASVPKPLGVDKIPELQK
jgi:mono/diheme cytochrome c family protein